MIDPSLIRDGYSGEGASGSIGALTCQLMRRRQSRIGQDRTYLPLDRIEGFILFYFMFFLQAQERREIHSEMGLFEDWLDVNASYIRGHHRKSSCHVRRYTKKAAACVVWPLRNMQRRGDGEKEIKQKSRPKRVRTPNNAKGWVVWNHRDPSRSVPNMDPNLSFFFRPSQMKTPYARTNAQPMMLW